MKNAFAFTLVGAATLGRAVTILYDGKEKTVEVHAVGPQHVRVFQVAGESSRPLPNWALMTFDKIEDITDPDIPSQAPREGYRKGDKQIKELLYEL